MRELFRSSEFKRQLKLAKKRGKDLDKLVKIVELLQKDEPLPEINKDHNLIGNFADYRECHIESDWLLIYRKIDKIELIDGKPVEVKILRLELTGTHSDLF